ncbi:hypothetical protein E4U41_001122 [Claviceps citrina]|nr:hypothetical protein E4U41_001122 [Claviceps citrina]
MFHESSGQVYREWTVSRQSIEARGGDQDWSRRRQFLSFNPKGTTGPRSLSAMAIHVVAANIGDVTEAHLDAIPNRYLWRIWRLLEARGASLHAWKLFSKILTTADEDRALGLYRFRKHICHPSDELKVYTHPLLSPTTEFLSHLVISGGCQFSTSELLCLTDLRNLAALEIIQPTDELRSGFSKVNDRLLRGWSEVNNPFPLMRILRIWVDRDITQNSLRWVTKFPSLALYDVRADKHDWEDSHAAALEHGWKIAGPRTRAGESLLRYLMLLAPVKRTQTNNLRDMVNRVETDLRSLCDDSGCAVKFVSNRRAPPLLEYLNDPVKACLPTLNSSASLREAPSCHRVSFEAWAFWLYSFIGQISGDEDLHSLGCNVDSQAVVGPFVLPSKPMVSLFLGHNGRGGIINTPSYVSRGLFSTKQMTFIRSSLVDKTGDRLPVSSPKGTKHARSDASSDLHELSLLRSNKRQRLGDVLQSFDR